MLPYIVKGCHVKIKINYAIINIQENLLKKIRLAPQGNRKKKILNFNCFPSSGRYTALV